MPWKTKLRLVTDLSMVIVLLLLMSYSLLGETAHEWIGIVMFLLFILHHGINSSWIRNLRGGKYTVSRLVRTVIDMLILFTMLGSMLSGIVISRHIFSFLPFGPEAGETGRAVHMFFAFWGFILMSLHGGMHLKMIAGMIHKDRGKTEGRMFSLCALLAVVYGACAFYRRQIISYLFLQTHFLMLGFDETLASYLFDYFMIMIFFMWIGYHLDKILKYNVKGKMR